uniref:Uncharacterized protein n=1 Tax=Angiostrongylus cantonensis TaxID=6313 RepID=A0A0K0D7H8_ANGCA
MRVSKHWAEIRDSKRPQGPSVSSVLIRQSDSPSPYQFQFDRFDASVRYTRTFAGHGRKPHKHQLTGQPTRSLEPILFPKLRI